MKYIAKNWKIKLISFLMAFISYFLLSVLVISHIPFNGCSRSFTSDTIGCNIKGTLIFIAFPYYLFTTAPSNILIGIFVIPYLVYSTIFVIYTIFIYRIIRNYLSKTQSMIKK